MQYDYLSFMYTDVLFKDTTGEQGKISKTKIIAYLYDNESVIII